MPYVLHSGGGDHVDTPLVRVRKDAHRVGDLCDLLESIADDLPRKSAPVWREASRHCATTIPDHYSEVIDALLPVLRRRTKGDIDCEAMLSQVASDFSDFRLRLSELSQLLTEGLAGGNAGIEPSTLGFALSGFFEPIRRHMDWEKEVLLPLAERRLTPADLEEIALML